ncbi:MAG: omptin family outer membrane protease [Treponema sp.]|jgi:outer membrane protease|nr:omptin family outer membrane protease [Treponema sp.]
MKTITVFCIFVSIGTSFLPLYADSGQASIARLKNTFRSYTLSLHPQFGMLWGQAEEQVYQDEDSEGLISQLLWDIKPLWYTGITMEFSQKDPTGEPGVFGVLSTKFGIPAISGIMEDRDWLASGGKLSNYSRHDNVTNGGIMLDLATGLSIPAWGFMTIRFFFGLSYTYFSWSAYDGYYRYGKTTGGTYPVYMPLTDSDPAVPMSGAVISYSQEWLLLPLGLRISIFPNRLFSGVLYCSAGPVILFSGRDNHYLRINTAYYSQFADETGGGYILESGGEFRFSPLEKFSLLLCASWRNITTTPHAKSFGRYAGNGNWNWDFLGNVAGGRFQSLDLGIGLEVRF